METTLRWALVTAIAPIAWGASYWVTQEFLPPDNPVWGSVLRALPGGLLLLLVARALPRGSWWWKSAVLGLMNVSVFFVLIYVAAQLLPSSIASTLMATSPAVMMLLAWPLIRERPRMLSLAGAALGFAGVSAMLLTGVESINPLGVAASLTAMLLSSVSFILSKRWGGEVGTVSLTAWQLTIGGLALIPAAFIIEGVPPSLDASELIAFAVLATVATALAYWAWFTGLRHLSAGAVGLIGLLNPVTGVLVGTIVAAELLSALQFAGMALVLVGILLGQPFVLHWARRRRERAAARLGRPRHPDAARAPAR